MTEWGQSLFMGYCADKLWERGEWAGFATVRQEKADHVYNIFLGTLIAPSILETSLKSSGVVLFFDVGRKQRAGKGSLEEPRGEFGEALCFVKSTLGNTVLISLVDYLRLFFGRKP